MANNTTTTNHLPSPASNARGATSSTAVNVILSFLALICIPILIYAFFFLLKCPPYPVEWRRRRNSGDISAGEGDGKAGHLDLVYESSCGDSKKKQETTSEEIDYDGECPVCLSMYVDGDKVRVLNVCKHRFHVSCINKWLVSHSNCPVCRASVRVKRSTQPSMAASHDLRQGLPDASSLV